MPDWLIFSSRAKECLVNETENKLINLKSHLSIWQGPSLLQEQFDQGHHSAPVPSDKACPSLGSTRANALLPKMAKPLLPADSKLLYHLTQITTTSQPFLSLLPDI